MRLATALLLWLLTLAVAAKGQEAIGSTEDFFDFPPCKPVQNFFLGNKYTYQYVGIVETQQHEIKNGALLNCSVEIKIPYKCAGTLSFNKCEVYESTPLPDGSLSYTTKSATLNRVSKLMRRNPVYFHFGDGMITKVFADPTEPSDVLNIKKAALSALQIDFRTLRRADLKVPVEYEEESIFGVGNVKAEIRTVAVGAPRRVTVERNTDNFKFPWRIEDYGQVHTPGETPNVRAFASNLISGALQKMEKPPVQKCEYLLERGRVIEEVACVEEKPGVALENDYLKWLVAPLLGNSDNIQAKITMNIKRKAFASMESNDRITQTERAQIKNAYTKHSVIYEEQWKEVIEGQFVAFDPESVMRDLILTPNDPYAAAKFAKIARYLPTLSSAEIQTLWSKLSRTYSGDEMEALTSLWVQILYRCSSLALRCHQPTCREALACQAGLQNFVSSNSMASWTPQIESGVMKAVAEFENPSAEVVALAYNIASQRTSPLSVLALGKVLVRHVKAHRVETLDSSVIQAINFLQTLLNSDCSISSSYNEHEVLMIAATKALNSLPASAHLNAVVFVNCAYNVNAPKPVALEAVRAFKKLTLTPAMRAKVMTIFADNSRPIEVRLSCYVYLINNQPTMGEFGRISDIVALDETPKAVKYYVKQHIKTQIQYRGTRFCMLSRSFADNILKSLRRNNWVEVDLHNQVKTVTEKEYNYARPIYVPYLRREINFFVKSSIIMPLDSIIPLLANVGISGEIEGKNLTLLELTLDLNKMISLLRPLMGSGGLFQEPRLEELLNLPLSQLLASATNEMPPLTEAELRSLAHIQDEAFVAYDMLKMQDSWPIYIRLLNSEIDLNNLFKMPWLRGLNLNILWKLSQEFESGKTFNGLEADEPIRIHTASPTSIGLPHVQHLNLAYYYNLQSTLTAQIRNIFLYGRGTISAMAKPVLRSSVEWSHKIQLPGGATCGAGYLVNVGHNSDISVSMNVEPYEVTMNFAPLPEITELITLTTNNLAVVNGLLKVIPRPAECAKTCLESNCNRGTHLHYKNCFNHPVDIGLYLRSDERFHYQLKVDTGELISVINNDNVEGKGIEVSLGRRASATDTNIANQWKIGCKYFPTLSQLRWEYTYQDQQPWVVILKSALQRIDVEDEQSPMDYYQAAFKWVRPDGTNAYNNELKISRQANPESAFYELMSYFSHHSSEAPTYTVDGKFQLPVLGHYMAKGLVKSEDTNLASYTARVVLRKGTVKQPGPTIGHFSIQTNPVTDGAMTGFLTVAKVEEMAMPMVPFTEIIMRLRSINDTTGNCRNIVHLEGMRRDGRPTSFVNLRYDLTETTPTNRAIQATLTCNTWQTQMDFMTPNTTAITMTTRALLPAKDIPNTLMDSNQQNEVRIGEYDIAYNPTCITWDLVAMETTDGATSLKMDWTTTPSKSPVFKWAIPEQISYYTHMTWMPNVCNQCHNLNIKLPYLSMTSRYLRNSWLDVEWRTGVDVHKNMLSYLYLPHYVHVLLNRYYTNDRLTFGFAESIKQTTTDHDVSASLMYYFSERRFNANAWLNASGDWFDDYHFVCNMSCSRCVPLLETVFKTDLSIKGHSMSPSELAEFAPKDRGYNLNIEFVHNHPEVAAIATSWKYEIIRNKDLKRLRTSFNFRYENLYQSMYSFLSNNVLELPLALNITIKPDAPSGTSAHDVSMSFGPRSLWQGTIHHGPVVAARFPTVCTGRKTCMYSNVSMSQITNCPDFSVFFAGKEAANVYSRTRCSTLGMDTVWSGAASRTSIKIDGRHDPTMMIDHLDVILEQTRSRKLLELTSELSRPIMFIPVKTNVRVLVDRPRVEALLNTGTWRVEARYSENEEFMWSVATTGVPVELDCVYRATVVADSMSIAIPRCAFRFRPLTSNAIYNTTVVGSVSSASRWNLNINMLADNQPLMKIQAALAGNTLSTKAFCGDGVDSPCNITATFTPSSFAFNARLYENNLNCAWMENNLLLNVATPTLTFKTTLQLTPTVRVVLNFNSPTIFSNSIVWDNGLQSMNLEGRSVRIPGFAVPCSWRCMYQTTPAMPTHWDMMVSFGVEATYRYKYFKGSNNPVLPFHIPSISTSSQLHLLKFEYRTSNSLAFFDNLNVYTEDWERLLTTTWNTTINVWPFVKESTWRSMVSTAWPLYSCSTCMGPIAIYAKYDASKSTEEHFNATVLLVDTADIVMNYTTRTRNSESLLYLKGSTNIRLGRLEAESRPAWLIVKHIDIAQSSYKVDITIQSSGLDENILLETKNNYRVSTSLSSKMQLRSPFASLRYLIEVDSTRALITCSYPDTRDALLLLDVDVNQDRIQVRDARITLGMHQWQLSGMTASLVRNIDQNIVGFSLQNLRFSRTCKCSAEAPCPCEFTVVGNARVELGGEWNIHIRDTLGKMINVRFVLTPSDPISLETLVHLNLPVVLLDMTFTGQYSQALVNDNMTMSMTLRNPMTGKMVPVVKSWYRSNMAVDANTNMMKGYMYFTTHYWNLLSPGKPISNSLNLTFGPNAELEGREIYAAVNIGEWMTTQRWIYSSECYRTYTMGRIEICDPRRMSLDATVDFPLLKSTANWRFEDNRWHGTTLFDMYQPTGACCKPWYHFTESFDLEWISTPDFVSGSYNITSHLMWPMDVSTTLVWTMKPNEDRTAKTTTISIGIQDNLPITLVHSPASNMMNHVRITSGNQLILNSDMVVSNCLSQVEVICIPSRIQLSNLDVNLPITAMLRTIPVLKGVVPDNGMFDLSLENSGATMTITCANSACTITTNVQMNGPSMPENLIMDSTFTMSVETWHYRMTLNHWDAMNTWTWTPATMAFICETTMTTPWVRHRSTLNCPGPLMLDEMTFMLKTMGDMRDVLPIDIDLEYHRHTSAGTWNLNLRSCSISIPSFMVFNVSLGVDGTLTPIRLRWEMSTASYPMLNHIVSVVLRTTVPSEQWTCNLMISNIFLWTKTTWNLTPRSVVLNDLVTGLPDNPHGVNIRYELEAATSTKIAVLTYNDRNTVYQCTGRPMQTTPNSLAVTCTRTEPTPAKAPARPVTVAEWQMDASYMIGYDVPNADWLRVLKFLVTFNTSRLMDQPWVEETLRTRFHVSDPDLCTRLSTYICNANKRLIDTWRNRMDPKLVSNVLNKFYQLGKPYYSYVKPYLKPIVKYLSKDYLQIGLKTVGNDEVFVMNVTCPKCKRVTATIEIKLSTDAHERPIITMTCTTPKMTATTTLTTTFPIRPVSLHWVMGTNEVSMTTETDEHDTLMGMTMTAKMGTGRAIRCVAERASATTMSMPCVCNKLEGDTLGPEVARFNIPILFMETLYAKINEYSAYTVLKNIPAKIKQDLALSVEAAHKLDLYIANLKQYVFNQLYPVYGESSVVLGRINLGIASVTIIMETPNNNIHTGWKMVVSSVEIPELNQEMKISLLNVGNEPILNLYTMNQFYWMYGNWNVRTWEFFNASFSLVGSSECVNITTRRSDADRTVREFEIRFKDVNGSPYTCIVNTERAIRLTCNVEVEGVTHQVCNVEWSKETFGMKGLMVASMMTTPMVYQAAVRPTEFKRKFRRWFSITNREASDVLCDYISMTCQKLVNYMNDRSAHYIVKYNVAYMAKFYNKELAKMFFESWMSSNDFILYRTTLKRFIDNAISQFGRALLDNLVEKILQIESYYRKVKRLSYVFLDKLPSTNVLVSYKVKDYIHLMHTTTENVHFYHYEYATKLLTQTSPIARFWNFLQRSWGINVGWLLFNSQGPIYYNILTPTINQVITSNGGYLELPTPEENSQCSYVYVTDPARNRFSVISKGRNLILALPGKLIELASSRTAYVTTTSRQLVNLPYVADDVICGYRGDTAYCQCPYLSLVIKFAANNRFLRSIRLYNEVSYVIGAMGTMADGRVPTLFLPNGDEAQTTTELLNAYSLKENCARVMSHIPMHWDAESHGVAACESNLPSNLPAHYSVHYATYKKACSLGNVGEYPVDPCWYRQVFSQYMRSMMDSNYMHCCPSPVHKSLYIMLSLSADSNRISAAKVARKIAMKSKRSDAAYDSIFLVTYGASEASSHPTVLDLTEMSDNEIRQVIRDLHINGPRYSHESTLEALRYMAEHYRSASGAAVAKTIALIAPEKPRENCGMTDMNALIEDLVGDSTSVFMYSRLTQEQCKQMRINLVLNTGGVCVTKSTRVMVQFMDEQVTHLSKLQRSC